MVTNCRTCQYKLVSDWSLGGRPVPVAVFKAGLQRPSPQTEYLPELCTGPSTDLLLHRSAYQRKDCYYYSAFIQPHSAGGMCGTLLITQDPRRGETPPLKSRQKEMTSAQSHSVKGRISDFFLVPKHQWSRSSDLSSWFASCPPRKQAVSVRSLCCEITHNN